MKYKIAVSVLALSVLIVLVGGHTLRTNTKQERPKALPVAQASVTVPGPEDPVVVAGAVSTNTRGWSHAAQGAGRAGVDGLRPELVDAYTLAAALAPEGCHLSVSLLAAIGQVESGNLADREIDASHRASPAVLGPVLNGKGVAAIPDTDDARWDGNRDWDRALGPLQLIPASWRVVGLDMDGDGLRDPQNVYDAAGAAMVYLCAEDRDLATPVGLNKALMAYNHSSSYVKLVLDWKTVFDAADITGLDTEPALGAWAMPEVAPQTTQIDASSAGPSDITPTKARAVTRKPGSSTTPATAAKPGTTGPAASPTKPSVSASPPGPAPSQPSAPDPEPTTPSEPPTQTPDPAPLPECPVPTTDAGAATPPADAATEEPAPDGPVVSPDTCTPPDGYEFDPGTGELVPVPLP